MVGNKGGRTNLGRKVLKIIPPRPGRNDALFSPEVKGATVYPPIFTAAPQPYAEKGRQHPGFQNWQEPPTEDHSWDIHKMRTKGGISQ